MTRQQIIEQINEVLAAGFELEAEQLVPNAKLKEDLRLDSLDAVDMLVHLEENFKVKVDGERLAQIRTLADVYAMVEDVLVASDKQTDQSGAL